MTKLENKPELENKSELNIFII